MGDRAGSTPEDLFSEALARPAEERGAFLARACAGNDELRAELAELLELHGVAGGFFDRLSGEIAAAAESELETAARPQLEIGPYRVDGVIGHGGMGVVYRASRADGEFEQTVALKLLHLDMHTPQVQARFLAERQLLARFQHPNIARLLDGGVTDEGRPYFVMELIEGRPITEYCRERALSLEATLGLFLDVVGAVSYLHRNLVVHRDLNPSNIFVRADGVVKLLDFGVAKLLAEEADGAARTLTGEQLLTPQYAAPEQILNERISTATDTYGLGVVLFELLSGRRPHDRRTLDIGAVKSEVAVAPGAALRHESAGLIDSSGAPPWQRVPRDLDFICLKALRPEPEQRYVSAEQLGQDLELYLTGLPVTARAGTASYRLGKFVRRNWRGVAAALLLAALVALGFARERALRGRAQREAVRAEAVSGFLGRLISSADPAQAQGREITVAEVVEQAEALLDGGAELGGEAGVEAAVRVVLGKTYVGLGRLSQGAVQLERALELEGGPQAESVTALEAMEALATIHEDLGFRDRLLERLLEVRRETLGPEHPETLQALIRLGRNLRGLGRVKEAEAVGREVLEVQRRTLGPRDPDTLRAENFLAGVLFYAARYREAAEIYERLLPIVREVLGASHPDTLRLVSNLGSTYAELGRYVEAEPLQREVVRERLRVLGDEHHQTGMSLGNLGVLLLGLGEYAEAESVLKRSVHARAEQGGLGYLYSKSYLADALRDLGRWAEAEALYLEVLPAQESEEQVMVDNSDTLRTMSALAELRSRQGDLEAARELAASALAGQEKISTTRGVARIHSITTLEILARVARSRGRREEAKQLIERSVALGVQALGAEHPRVLEARLERARILLAAGEIEGAAAEARSVHAARRAAFGDQSPKTADALEVVVESRRSTPDGLEP